MIFGQNFAILITAIEESTNFGLRNACQWNIGFLHRRMDGISETGIHILSMDVSLSIPLPRYTFVFQAEVITIWAIVTLSNTSLLNSELQLATVNFVNLGLEVNEKADEFRYLVLILLVLNYVLVGLFFAELLHVINGLSWDKFTRA